MYNGRSIDFHGRSVIIPWIFMAMNLQQQPATGLRLGGISKPALSSFHRVSVSLPFKPIKQSIVVTTQTNKKCPFFKDPIFVTAQTHKNPFLVKCSNLTPGRPDEVDLIDSIDGYGTLYNSFNHHAEEDAADEIISMMSKQQIGCASALDQLESTRSGKLIRRRFLHALVRNLDEEQRYQDALQVYEWMSNKEKRYKFMTPAEISGQLYLIAKVHGISSAEQYLLKVPDTLKNKALYHVLLVRYAVARRVTKAESFFDEMRNRGYGCNASQFNVMMMLYKEIKCYDKIRLMISKMIEENILLDALSYESWLWVSRTKECLDELLEHVEQETNLDIFWDVLDRLFEIYLKDLKHIEKAGQCVKVLESRFTNEKFPKDRYPAEDIINKYLHLGETREVLRVWENNITRYGFYSDLDSHLLITELLSFCDVEGAEKIYDEWVSHGPTNLRTSKANFFLEGIVSTKGLSGKTEPFFNKMIKSGVVPNLRTLEILTQINMKLRWISEALSCLHKCVEESHKCEWYRDIVHGIIKICEEEGDMASKDAVFILSREMGCSV